MPKSKHVIHNVREFWYAVLRNATRDFSVSIRYTLFHWIPTSCKTWILQKTASSDDQRNKISPRVHILTGAKKATPTGFLTVPTTVAELRNCPSSPSTDRRSGSAQLSESEENSGEERVEFRFSVWSFFSLRLSHSSSMADLRSTFLKVYSVLKEELLNDPAFEFTDASRQWIERVTSLILLRLFFFCIRGSLMSVSVGVISIWMNECRLTFLIFLRWWRVFALL